MNIVLGLYKTEYFKEISLLSNNCSFPFTEIEEDIIEVCDGDIIDIVVLAAHRCDKIIFIIDNLKPNIKWDGGSYTAQELIILLEMKFHDKMEFIYNKEVITLDKVVSILNLPKEYIL